MWALHGIVHVGEPGSLVGAALCCVTAMFRIRCFPIHRSRGASHPVRWADRQ